MNLEALERNVKIDVPKSALDMPPVDGAIGAQEVGAFTGTIDALKDIVPAAVLSTTSSMYGAFGGFWERQIQQAAVDAEEQGISINENVTKDLNRKLEAEAKELRRRVREEYTPDPETTGFVGQTVYGIGTELTKAAAASATALGNPGAAALLYGAEHGISKAQNLKDAGVDELTATRAGVTAFATGTIGMWLPAARGASRLQSAIYGAVVNPAMNVAEDQTIKTILEAGNAYTEAAKINAFDPVNLLIASVVGGGFGAMGWRKSDAQVAKEAKAADKKLAEQEGPKDSRTGTEKALEAARGKVEPAPADTSRSALTETADVASVREASARRLQEEDVGISARQNRNRNTAASVAQMASIAGNPDYTRLSASRVFSDGAPAIGFVHDLPPEQLGRTEIVSASDGSHFEMRYAVMEARDIQYSTRVDGSRVEGFEDVKKNVAIAGNGRVAGLEAAYDRGNAAGYKAAMMADDYHGISAGVIQKMEKPVLVRIMQDKDAARPDIAMLSNRSGTLALSATEQAQNDAAAIDVAALKFGEEGEITDETIRQFAALVPDNASLVDRNGVPNTMAKPRLERAIFQRAYGNANLTSLLTDADGVGGRVVSVLLRTAPKMMQLEGVSELDFRKPLVDAVNEIYAARASGSGMSIREIAATQSIGRTPETQAFLDYFATIGNNVKGPSEVFNKLADWALFNRADPNSMFADESPQATRVDLMQQFQELTGVQVDPHVLDMVGAQVTRAEKAQRVLSETRAKLAEAGFPEDQVEAQAQLFIGMVMRLADLSGRDPLDLMPKIKMGSGERTSVEFNSELFRVGARYAASYAAEAVSKAKPLVMRIINRVLSGQSTHGRGRDSFEDYLPVTDEAADEIRLKTGHDVRGYVHTVVDSDLAHVRNRHGEGAEKRPDQHPLDAEDYLRVPEVVSSPDRILRGGLTRTGARETIIYEKALEDGTTIVIEEIRTGRRKLALKTAYKKIPSAPDVPGSAGPRALRPKRSEAASSLEESIDQRSSGVNQYSSSEFPQVAYHGTPHVFESFSTSAIGTGEGAQAHGWGLYFTKNREVAQGYRDRLLAADMEGEELMPFKQEFAETKREEFDRLLEELDPEDEADSSVIQTIEALRDEDTSIIDMWDTVQDPDDMADIDNRAIAYVEEAFNYSLSKKSGGRIFEVDIPEDRVLLDEQKPLSQQPETVRAAISSLLPDIEGDPDGRSLYSSLSSRYGGDRAASLALKDRGVEGITYLGGSDGRCFVVFSDKAINVTNYWQSSGGEIRGAYNAVENIIRLTPNADITTFSHEVGHWWLNNLFEITKSKETDLALRKDARILLDHFGIKDQAEWDALGVEGQRQYHEAFASYVEEFLTTGRAPTPQMRNLLEKFRQWIVAIYRDFRAHLNERYKSQFGVDLPPLSEEVRGVLERNMVLEDSLAAAYKDIQPTHAASDAARYRLFERTVRSDQPVDPSNARDTQASLFAEKSAADSIDSGEKVSVQAPADVDRVRGEQQMLIETLGGEAAFRTKPPEEGMPVTAPERVDPVSEEAPDVESETRPNALFRALSDFFLGGKEEATPKVEPANEPADVPRSGAADDVARTQAQAEDILQRYPDLKVEADAEDGSVGRSARDLIEAVNRETEESDRFADVLPQAAECVIRNGGI